MENIKNYKLFLENKEEYSIYEWFEELKMMMWSKKNINYNELEKNVERFIGKEWFKKINDKIDSIYNSFSKVNLENIEDRLLYIWDELPENKQKYVYLSVLYGDYYNIYNENDTKYNGMINSKNKKDILIHILINIVLPTLWISFSPKEYLRKTKEQISVSDPIWNCENFNINNYEFDTVLKSDINEKNKYSVQNVLEMYQPGIVIDFGRDSLYNKESSFSIKKIENLFDNHIEAIVNDLEYEEIIWDYSRYKRRFSSDDPVYDYTLKILLK
jgi:hypothetical protein